MTGIATNAVPQSLAGRVNYLAKRHLLTSGHRTGNLIPLKVSGNWLTNKLYAQASISMNTRRLSPSPVISVHIATKHADDAVKASI